MRTFIAAILLGAILVIPAGLTGDVKVKAPPPKNAFLLMNPGYRERAGTFYEQNYLAGAAASLTKAVNSTKLPEQTARTILRELIYAFLDGYIKGQGEISSLERSRVIEQIDKRVQETVQDGAAFQKYLQWRQESSAKENPLQFLFHYPLQPQLPANLLNQGWTFTAIGEPEKLKAYKDYCGFPPDQAVHYSNAKIAPQGKGPSLLLLVYPLGRMQTLLASRDLPAGVEIFWPRGNHLICCVAGQFPQQQRAVATAIKRHLLEPSAPMLKKPASDRDPQLPIGPPLGPAR